MGLSGISKIYEVVNKEIEKLTNEKILFEQNVMEKDIIENIINQFRTSSVSEITENIDLIRLQLSYVSEFAKINLNDKLYNAIALYNKTVKYENEELKDECFNYLDEIIHTLENYVNNLKKINKPDLDEIKFLKSIYYCIENRQFINEEKIVKIRELLEKENISDENFIVIFEELYHYNSNSIERNKSCENFNIQHKYTIFNMLNLDLVDFSGFKIDKELEIKVKSRVNDLFNTWKSNYRGNRELNIEEQLPEIDIELNKLEFIAYIKQLLILIQVELLNTKQLILEKDFYFDKEIKNEILSSYVDYLIFYKKIHRYALKKLNPEKYDDEFTYEDGNDEKYDLPEDYDTEPTYQFVFTTRKNGETFFLNDIKKYVPETYYDTVINLLMGKMYSNLSKTNDKIFKNHNGYKNMHELKDGQVRIFYRYHKGNVIEIVGVGVKKSDIDRNLHQRNAARPTISEDEIPMYLQSSKDDLTVILDYCHDNRIKGNRK